MEEERKDPDQLIRWLAVGILFVGLTDLITSVFFLVGGDEIGSFIERFVREQQPDFKLDPAMFESNIILTAIGLLISLLVVVGSVTMLNKKSWALSLVAAILVMIPCVGPCCGLFLPIGIWAIIVLMKPEVKEAMASSSQ